MAYSIGNLITGNKSEKVFEEIEDAEIAALEASDIDHSLWHVRDEEDGELVSLAFGQRVFN